MWEVSHTKFKAYFNACIIIENPHAVKDLTDFNFKASTYTKAPQAVLSSPPYSPPRAALMNADILPRCVLSHLVYPRVLALELYHHACMAQYHPAYFLK